MTFAVSQWPYSPDPRSPSFDITGYDFGQVPPWAWRLSTTNATGLAAPFNGDGVIVKPFSFGTDFANFSNVDLLPDSVIVTLGHRGFPAPIPPDGDTMFHSFVVWQGILPQFSASMGLEWPVAIAERDFPIATKVGIGIGTMPDPLTATPEIWNV